MVQSCLWANTVLRTQQVSLARTFCRHKSITAAIERGIQRVERDQRFGSYTPRDGAARRSRDVTYDPVQRSQRGGRDVTYEPVERFQKGGRDGTYEPVQRFQRGGHNGTYEPVQRFQRGGHDRTYEPDQHRPRGGRNRFYEPQPGRRQSRGAKAYEMLSREGRPDESPEITYRHERSETAPVRTRDQDTERAPEALPYTSAASEFLYGYSSVLAALKSSRRKLYKLYIHNRGLNHDGRDAIVARARAVRLPIQEVGDEYLRVFDKTSNGRPHNGFILETSPLPVPPINALGSTSITSGTFEMALDKQSKEDEAVNGTQTLYTYKSSGWRHPLVLYVDGVLDEGNLGAIARSAYFLGVDAIITPTRQTAPWSHITLKASAGAAEAIPIFQASQTTDFLGKSARAGWRIYASDAIPAAEQRPHLVTAARQPSLSESASEIIYTYAKNPKRLPVEHSPVASHPTILMMGGEGAGLRSSLLNLAHFKVGIRHGREVDEVGVDSLNVSVAASLLCYEMLQKPKQRRMADDLVMF